MNYKKIVTFCLLGLATFFTECSEKRSLKDLLNTNDVDPLDEVYGPHIRSSNIIIESASKKIKANKNLQNPDAIIHTPNELPIKINANNFPVDNSSNSNSEIYTSSNPFSIEYKGKKIKLNFKDIDNKEKYKKKLDEIGNEIEIQLTCDHCHSKRNTKLTHAYTAMVSHRKSDHHICKCNKLHESLSEAINCNKCCRKYTPKVDIIINFAEIKTQTEYVNKLKEIGKKTHVCIRCDHCEWVTNRKFSAAHLAIILHRKSAHGICKCNIQHTNAFSCEKCN